MYLLLLENSCTKYYLSMQMLATTKDVASPFGHSLQEAQSEEDLETWNELTASLKQQHDLLVGATHE